MTTQRLDGGNQGIELLLVIVIVAMLATIVATSFDLFDMSGGRTACAVFPDARIGSSTPVDNPIEATQSLAQPDASCAG
jgi:hypothetical protein